MPSTAEIKRRIKSVEDTKKITNAMYLIASTKLTKAKNALEQTRPYFDALRSEIRRIFRTAGDTENVSSPYFYSTDQVEKKADAREDVCGCLVITADKGLAGAYNQNVLKRALELLERHPRTELYVVGEYGRHFFDQRKIPIEHSFLYTAQNPTLDRAREISALLLDKFDRGLLRRIYVIYTDMHSGLEMVTHAPRILPFDRGHFLTRQEEGEREIGFEFHPSVTEVLNGIIPSYVSGFIYSALIDSFCSEQNARMTAMDAANQNAEELLDTLSKEYNRIRQANITQEITEITAGAKAQGAKSSLRKEVGTP